MIEVIVFVGLALITYIISYSVVDRLEMWIQVIVLAVLRQTVYLQILYKADKTHYDGYQG
jgi:hypothetical protein